MRLLLIALTFCLALPAHATWEALPDLSAHLRQAAKQKWAVIHDLRMLFFDQHPIRYQSGYRTLRSRTFITFSVYLPHKHIRLQRVPGISCYVYGIRVRCGHPPMYFEPYIGFPAPIKVQRVSIEH